VSFYYSCSWSCIIPYTCVIAPSSLCHKKSPPVLRRFADADGCFVVDIADIFTYSTALGCFALMPAPPWPHTVVSMWLV